MMNVRMWTPSMLSVWPGSGGSPLAIGDYGSGDERCGYRRLEEPWARRNLDVQRMSLPLRNDMETSKPRTGETRREPPDCGPMTSDDTRVYATQPSRFLTRRP